MRVEIPHLVTEKLLRQKKPDAIGTLKRVDCEIGNLLDCGVLDTEWKEIFDDLQESKKCGTACLEKGKSLYDPNLRNDPRRDQPRSVPVVGDLLARKYLARS